MTQDIARTQREKSPLSCIGEEPEVTVPRADRQLFRDYRRTRGTEAHKVPSNGFKRVPRTTIFFRRGRRGVGQAAKMPLSLSLKGCI